MDQALIVFLVILWAVVLVPGAIRARRRSTANSVHGFGKAMDVLKPRPGRQVLTVKEAPQLSGPIPLISLGTEDRQPRPTATGPTAIRRRNLVVLSVASTVSLLLGLIAGGGFWALWLVFTAALGAYVAWLRNLAVQKMRAEEIVEELADIREARELAQLSSNRSSARAVGD